MYFIIQSFALLHEINIVVFFYKSDNIYLLCILKFLNLNAFFFHLCIYRSNGRYIQKYICIMIFQIFFFKLHHTINRSKFYEVKGHVILCVQHSLLNGFSFFLIRLPSIFLHTTAKVEIKHQSIFPPFLTNVMATKILNHLYHKGFDSYRAVYNYGFSVFSMIF